MRADRAHASGSREEPVHARYPAAVGGVGEAIVDGQSGLLVPYSDSTALAAACLKVLSDTNFAAQLALAGYARVSENYSSTTMHKRTLALYEELWKNATLARA